MNWIAINKLPWPENLLRHIFMEEDYDEWKNQIPPDFEASFKFILEETLTERETYILYAFFRNRMKLREIGEQYGIKAERVAQIRDKAIRRIKHPSRCKYLKYGMEVIEKWEKEPPKATPVEKNNVIELDLGVKAFNCLYRANITTIEQLTMCTKSQLRQLRNMGVGTLAEVERKLNERGLALRRDDE